jgi:hypothetical protein
MARTKAEIGGLGLPLFNGYLSLDTNARLRGRSGAKIYREMMLDEPCAGAFVAACNTLFRTDLQVTTGGNKEGDKRAGEFLEQCLEDMRDSKDTLLRRSFSSVPYGFSILELVYKRRSGGTGSRYTDGKVGWATWALRRQETLEKWGSDAQGRITDFIQRPAPTYDLRTLPLYKCLHVVADDTEGSPEGRSALRSMYKPAYFVKNLELLWGISLERFGTGIPVFEREDNVELTPEQQQTLEDIAASLRQNEEAYVITPPGIKFRFEPSPGLDADKYKSAILFFRTWALATALAEFITLGTGDTGSFALGQSKIDLFLKALTGYQDKLCEQINRQAITRLFRYNDFGKLTDLPRVSLPAVKEYDLEKLATFAQILDSIGMFHATPEDEAFIRKVSDLPDIDMQEIEAMHEADEERPGDISTGSTSALVQTDDDPSTAEEDMSVQEETQEDR